jgi:hypothetical protein
VMVWAIDSPQGLNSVDSPATTEAATTAVRNGPLSTAPSYPGT